MESILTSTKKVIGLTEDDTHFDEVIILHINSVFMILNQLGVGPTDGFRIEDKSSIWSDFTSDKKTIEAVKTYVPAKVKLAFDPPQASTVMTCLKELVAELESRLNYAVDPEETFRKEE